MTQPQPPLRRADRPPPRKGPELRVERVRGGESWSVVVLSEQIFGVWIHFDEHTRRSEQCIADNDSCPGHKKGLPSKWRGYLHCHGGRNNELHFLEITEEAARKLLDKVGEERGLRGLRVTFRRTAKDNGRLMVDVPEYLSRVESRHLFPAMDPEPILRWLWNWKRFQLPKG